MSRSRRNKGCGRGCGVCAALRSDLPKIREGVARRDLKPENVLCAVVDDNHVRRELVDYDANSDIYPDDDDDLWLMTREAPALRVSFLDAVRVR